MRKLFNDYKKFNSKSIVCVGDSITLNYVWGVKAFDYYPTVLMNKLNENGYNYFVRNFGVSGETTANMKSRQTRFIQYGIPNVVVLYGGINDGPTYTDTKQNLIDMAEYCISQGSKVIIVYRHYNNYSTGGDTTETPTSTLNTLQKEVYDELVLEYPNDVAFCDLYAVMRSLINNSTYTQGDWTSWHVADNNVHLNANGELIFANAVYNVLLEKNWVNKL